MGLLLGCSTLLRQSSEIIYLLFICCILLCCVVFCVIFPPRCATRVRHVKKEYSIGLIPWMQYVCCISHPFLFVCCFSCILFSCIVRYLFLLLLLLLFLLLSPYAVHVGTCFLISFFLYLCLFCVVCYFLQVPFFVYLFGLVPSLWTFPLRILYLSA